MSNNICNLLKNTKELNYDITKISFTIEDDSTNQEEETI